MLLTQERARHIVATVMGMAAKGEHVGVSMSSSEQVQTRYANNSITTSGRHQRRAVSISVTRDTRTGSCSLNEVTDEALRGALEKARELAAFAPPDPEYVEPLGPQNYPTIQAFDDVTASATQARILPAVKAAVDRSLARKVETAGFFDCIASAAAVANSAGNFGFHTSTLADYSLTSRTPDGTGSGWASGDSHRIADINGAELAERAIGKALRSRHPRPMEPGSYTVVLEPAAVRDLIPLLMGSFNARNAEEGRSLFTRRGGGTMLGERMFSDKVTLRSDPFDPRIPGMPWAPGGAGPGGGGGALAGGGGAGGALPNTRLTWIENGIVKNLNYTRYWAGKRGVRPTAAGGSLILDGEDHSLDDLIASTERGLLVTRFWYIRSVNPTTAQYTGLTRDGIFLIDKGKVAYPVNNFRWNESPASVLRNVEMMGHPERVNGALMPAMKVREFRFTSVSDAV